MQRCAIRFIRGRGRVVVIPEVNSKGSAGLKATARQSQLVTWYAEDGVLRPAEIKS